MYDSSRRRGRKGVVGARIRQVPAGSHTGSWKDFLCRYGREAEQAVHGNAVVRNCFLTRLHERTVDPRNLKHAWDYLAAGGGQAPGIDDLRYDDLEEHEAWDLLRTVSKAIRNDTYRPAPDRKQDIPKTSGHGTRVLSIPTIVDRIVQRAIVQTVQPYLDPTFDSSSMGYRPGYNRLHALAHAERLATDTDRWVWICEDLKDAFNQVPQNRLLDIVRHHLPNEKMMGLIETVVRTKEGRGLRQGGCLSPLLLNVYLDWFFDRKWKKRNPDIPFIRVADDLLVLCHSMEEAQRTYADLKQLLQPAGMPLKGTEDRAIRNLNLGQGTHWLGFELRKEDSRLNACLTEKAWNSLADKIADAHRKPHAALVAIDAINGWVSQVGPCFSQTDIPEAYKRISSLAHDHAFDEILSLEEISKRWQLAHARWRRLQSQSMRRDQEAVAVGSAYGHRNLTEDSQSGGASLTGAPPFSSRPKRKVVLYCDGSCDPNNQVGGWAFILVGLESRRRESRSGSSPRTTNNRMELLAVLRGLESLAEPARVRLVVDSEYVVLGIEEWLPRWKQQDWRGGSGRRRKEVKNRDLWQQLDRQLQSHEITCEWVRGHNGHPENEECDRRAREAVQLYIAQLALEQRRAHWARK